MHEPNPMASSASSYTGWEIPPFHIGNFLCRNWATQVSLRATLGIFCIKNWANLFGGLHLGVKVEFLDYNSSDFLSIWPQLICYHICCLYVCVCVSSCIGQLGCLCWVTVLPITLGFTWGRALVGGFPFWSSLGHSFSFISDGAFVFLGLGNCNPRKTLHCIGMLFGYE